jgi:hypothetical protein
VHLSDRHAAFRRKGPQGNEPSKSRKRPQNLCPDFDRLNAGTLVVGLIVLLGFRFYVHRLPFVISCKRVSAVSLAFNPQCPCRRADPSGRMRLTRIYSSYTV